MAEKETSIGLEENLAGAAAYFLGPISGIALYLMEKKNEFVRFHAVQSTIVFGAIFILNIVISMITSSMYTSTYGLFHGGGMMYMLTSGISTLISIVSFLLWLFLMYQAYQGKKYELPVVGGMAEKYI